MRFSNVSAAASNQKSSRALRKRLALSSALSLRLPIVGVAFASAIVAPHCTYAQSVILEGDYIRVGVNGDAGTLGYDGNTSPGILYDGTGTGTFNPSYDYLTPGTPFEAFIVTANGSTSANNNSAWNSVNKTTGSLTSYNGIAYNGGTYDNRAVWSGTNGSLYTITNDYYFNKADQQVNISTTITALTDLTNVSFARSIDPDARAASGDSSSTNNIRGTGSIPTNDLVYAEALASKYVIGLYTNSSYTHNSAVTNWTSDTASYLSGTDIGNGDKTIGLGFDIGNLLTGESAVINYSYIFGTDIEKAIDGASKANIISSVSADDVAAGNVNPVLEGGTIAFDSDSTLAVDLSLAAAGGTIDSGSNSAIVSGAISGTGGLTKAGDGVLTLTGANSYIGGTTVSGGTLVGNTTSLQGDIANNATLQFAQTTDGTYAGAVSGTGALVKTGSGVLTLTGANSYAGGTTITGGTLVGDTTSLQGDVANNATLQFAQGTDGTYAGAVSGSGALVKTGNGVLTLTGANSYTGGTTISGGTLVGDTNSLQGNVANNATLQFAQATDGTYAGTVSGSGALVKTGSGVLTLTGANSYTGGTTISGGTLVGDTTSLQGDVANNATLQFAQATDGVYTGTISGGGALVKTGAGKLNLTGASSYTGGTTVTQGTLAANGALASNVDVLADARLMGAGSIGGMIVRTAATLAPGNSIDTLTVDGDALFEVGSTYEVEVNAAGDSDLLNVSDTTTIEGGTIAVLAADGSYAPQTSYTIINAGAIDGTFDDVTSNFAFLTPTLGYTPTSVSVTLTRNDVAFAGVAATANQRASATAIDAAFGSGTTLYDALIGETAAGARQVFDNLSGEVHASAMRATLQDSERFRRSLLNRMDTAAGTGQRLWLQFAVAKDDVDTDYNAAGFKRETNSFFGGGEFVAGNFLLGVAGGYTDGDLKMADRASRADIDGKHFAAYASGNAGPIAISAGVTYGDFDVDSTRDIAAGAISQQADASYSARTIEAFGEAGMTFREGRSAITPFVGLSQLWLKRDGFAETGAGLGVAAGTQKEDWAAFTAGTRASVPLNASESVKLNLAARWQRQISETDVDTELAYVAGGPAFTVSGAPIAKDAGLVDAGLSWSVGGLGLSLDYSGTWTGVSQSHAGKATVGFRF